MGKINKLYETIYGYYDIEVEDGYVTAIRKKPAPEEKNTMEEIDENHNPIEDSKSMEDHNPMEDNHDFELMELAYQQLCEYLRGERREFTIPMNPHGTEFQKKVWNALCEIPYGEIRSYKQIAEAVGSPKACRAVGMANHVNPIIIAVPCHRVIGSSGKIVGYGQGIDMQIHLLSLEGITVTK